MATVVNFMDVTLRGAAARTVNLASAKILLTPSAPAFHVAADGTITPPSITFTATRIDIDAPLTFNCTGGPLASVTATTATLVGADMVGSSATVIASATVNGQTYTGPCTISKLSDGKDGKNATDIDLSPGALKDILEGQLTTDEFTVGLSARIGLIDAGAETAGSVAARVKYETDQRIAAIAQASTDNRTYVQQYTYSQQTINDSFSAFGTNIQAAYQGYANTAADNAFVAAKSFAQSYAYSRADSDSALTATANTLRSEFATLNQGTGATVAWVQEYAYSKAQANAAIASSTQQLSTTVDGHTATLETQGRSISGLGAQITTKIDNNGYVAGYGLASTPINGVPQSSFIVLADRFAVALPGQTPKFPFVIGTVNGQTVIGLRGDVVLDGTLSIQSTSGLSTAIQAAATTATGAGFSGTVGGDNLAPNSSFEVATNGSIADGYDIYNNANDAEPTTASFSAAGAGRGGVGRAQIITWTSANHSSTKGICGRNSKLLLKDWRPGQTYMVGIWARTTNIRYGAALDLRWNIPGPVSQTWVKNPALTPDWQLYECRITWGSGVEGGGRLYITVTEGAGDGNVWFDDLMVVEGDVLPAYYPSTWEAQAAADAANAKAEAISADGVLDRSEKSDLIADWQAEDAIASATWAQARALGLSMDAYGTAHNNAWNYISGLNPAWNDTSQNTNIDRPTYLALFTALYTERSKLQNAIAAKSATMASDLQMSNEGVLLGPGGAQQGKVQNLPVVDGARTVNYAPRDYGIVHIKEFKQCSSIGITGAGTTYCTLETMKQWIDSSGGYAIQWAYAGDQTWRRFAPCDAASWGEWIRDLDRSLYTGDLNASWGAPAGTTVAGAAAEVVAANAAAVPAMSQAINKKLQKDGYDVITGQIGLQSKYAILVGDTNNGIWIGSEGLVLVQGGVIKTTLPISGAPTFAGQLMAVSIAAAGFMQVGARTWDSGTGVWFGFHNGVAKFAVGVAGGAEIKWDGTQLIVINPTLQLASRTVSIVSPSGTTFSHPRATTGGYCGSHTASISNPVNPSYLWTAADNPWGKIIISNPTSATCGLTVVGPGGRNTDGLNIETDFYVTCTASDGGVTTSATIDIALSFY